jgi:CPA2 family monovalent cation:H+ antiporter-2
MSDPQAARRTVHQARQINADVRIVVRTRYVSEITELYDLGADEVIPEEFETSIEIFSRVLHRYGFKRNVIEGQIDRIRGQGYEMLRSPTVPQEPVALPAGLDAASTEPVFLSGDSPVIGKKLGELNIRDRTGVTIIAVVRGGETHISPGARYQLEEGDTVVVLGLPERLEEARDILAPGSSDVGGFNP